MTEGILPFAKNLQKCTLNGFVLTVVPVGSRTRRYVGQWGSSECKKEERKEKKTVYFRMLW